MSKPIVNKITAFDANKDYTVTMSYIGNLSYRNRIVIYEAQTLNLVYDQTVATTSLSQTIPASTLVNGTKYYIQAMIYEKDNTSSSWSDKVYFYCYSTPSFYFMNVTSGDTINAASLYAKLIYSQIQNEELTAFQFYIYDSGKTLLSTSDMFYSTQYLTYGYTGLENDTIYYIRAQGSTKHEMQLDTGYIQIYVSYVNHDDYALVFADCDSSTSIVTYHTRFIMVNPSTTEDFVYDDGLINLIGKQLAYDQSFNLSGDFTITIRAIDMYRNGTVMTCNNGSYTMTLSSMIYDDETLRFKLVVPNGLNNYILYSSALDVSNEQMVTIHIRRINNVYSLTTFVNDYSTQTDYWWGTVDPSGSDLTVYDIWIDEDTTTKQISKDDIKIAYQSDEPDTSGAVDFGTIWIGGNS